MLLGICLSFFFLFLGGNMCWERNGAAWVWLSVIRIWMARGEGEVISNSVGALVLKMADGTRR